MKNLCVFIWTAKLHTLFEERKKTSLSACKITQSVSAITGSPQPTQNIYSPAENKAGSQVRSTSEAH